MLSKPTPLGLGRGTDKCYAAPAGRGLRVMAVHRMRLARIGALELDVEVCRVAELTTGQMIDSEVSASKCCMVHQVSRITPPAYVPFMPQLLLEATTGQTLGDTTIDENHPFEEDDISEWARLPTFKMLNRSDMNGSMSFSRSMISSVSRMQSAR